MFKQKPPITKTITAIQFIPFEDVLTVEQVSAMIVVGYSDGSVSISNPLNNYATILSSNQLPFSKPAVTAITAIKLNNEHGTTRCIIGFSNWANLSL